MAVRTTHPNGQKKQKASLPMNLEDGRQLCNDTTEEESANSREHQQQHAPMFEPEPANLNKSTKRAHDSWEKDQQDPEKMPNKEKRTEIEVAPPEIGPTETNEANEEEEVANNTPRGLKRPCQQPAEWAAGKRRRSLRNDGNSMNYDEKKRRTNSPPTKIGKRQKTTRVRYFEDGTRGGGELKQLIKLGTYGIMAIERKRRYGDG